MSQKPFSNTEVPSDKPADPYTATNKSEPDLKEKVQDLVSFIESCKFGMMTTRIGSSGLLTSRCMALAAKVSNHPDSNEVLGTDLTCNHRRVAASTFSFIPIQSRARRMTSNPTPKSTSPSSTPPVNGPRCPERPTSSPIEIPSVNTIHLPSKHGLGISKMVNMMVAQKIPELASSRSRP